jgi:preprotein translocase subunit SecD
MNRYPVWKYVVIAVALLIAVLYTLPNFFGEAPAVQVSSAKSTVKVDSTTVVRVEQALKEAGVRADAVTFDGNSVRARFNDTDTQLKARDVVQKALSPDPADSPYIVALNLLSRSPLWLTSLHAAPMYLGLDLRGGVHFMLQVDMQAALTKKTESLTGDLRLALREKNIRHSGISRNAQAIEVRFRDSQTLNAAKGLIQDSSLTCRPPMRPKALNIGWSRVLIRSRPAASRIRHSSRTWSLCITGSTNWVLPSR